MLCYLFYFPIFFNIFFFIFHLETQLWLTLDSKTADMLAQCSYANAYKADRLVIEKFMHTHAHMCRQGEFSTLKFVKQKR